MLNADEERDRLRRARARLEEQHERLKAEALNLTQSYDLDP
jgi:hypothetical protein